MIPLGHDHHAVHVEDHLGAVHRFIGGKSRMIEKNILLGNSFVDGVLFHGVHFIIYDLSIVAGKQQLRSHSLLVEGDAEIQPIPQHFARCPVRSYGSAEHHDTLRICGTKTLHLL